MADRVRNSGVPLADTALEDGAVDQVFDFVVPDTSATFGVLLTNSNAGLTTGASVQPYWRAAGCTTFHALGAPIVGTTTLNDVRDVTVEFPLESEEVRFACGSNEGADVDLEINGGMARG